MNPAQNICFPSSPTSFLPPDENPSNYDAYIRCQEFFRSFLEEGSKMVMTQINYNRIFEVIKVGFKGLPTLPQIWTFYISYLVKYKINKIKNKPKNLIKNNIKLLSIFQPQAPTSTPTPTPSFTKNQKFFRERKRKYLKKGLWNERELKILLWSAVFYGESRKKAIDDFVNSEFNLSLIRIRIMLIGYSFRRYFLIVQPISAR